jgi:hypothetical protein
MPVITVIVRVEAVPITRCSGPMRGPAVRASLTFYRHAQLAKLTVQCGDRNQSDAAGDLIDAPNDAPF